MPHSTQQTYANRILWIPSLILMGAIYISGIVPRGGFVILHEISHTLFEASHHHANTHEHEEHHHSNHPDHHHATAPSQDSDHHLYSGDHPWLKELIALKEPATPDHSAPTAPENWLQVHLPSGEIMVIKPPVAQRIHQNFTYTSSAYSRFAPPESPPPQ